MRSFCSPPEGLNAAMRNVFSYCFRKPHREVAREEEIESEATIYLVLKGLQGLGKPGSYLAPLPAVDLLHREVGGRDHGPPTRACPLVRDEGMGALALNGPPPRLYSGTSRHCARKPGDFPFPASAASAASAWVAWAFRGRGRTGAGRPGAAIAGPAAAARVPL